MSMLFKESVQRKFSNNGFSDYVISGTNITWSLENAFKYIVDKRSSRAVRYDGRSGTIYEKSEYGIIDVTEEYRAASHLKDWEFIFNLQCIDPRFKKHDSPTAVIVKENEIIFVGIAQD